MKVWNLYDDVNDLDNLEGETLISEVVDYDEVISDFEKQNHPLIIIYNLFSTDCEVMPVTDDECSKQEN